MEENDVVGERERERNNVSCVLFESWVCVVCAVFLLRFEIQKRATDNTHV